MVMVGIDQQPICIPRNAAITVLGIMAQVNCKKLYLLKLAAHNNLPSGIVVNHYCVTSRARRVSVILVNTTSTNFCKRQSLLVAEMYEAELQPWHY